MEQKQHTLALEKDDAKATAYRLCSDRGTWVQIYTDEQAKKMKMTIPLTRQRYVGSMCNGNRALRARDKHETNIVRRKCRPHDTNTYTAMNSI